MRSNKAMIKKLQTAINMNGGRILYETHQWYSEEQNRPITNYVIKELVKSDITGRNKHIELFSSTSQIQVVLFLRDYWFEMSGQEVPTDNEMWNEAKERYYAKHGGKFTVKKAKKR